MQVKSASLPAESPDIEDEDTTERTPPGLDDDETRTSEPEGWPEAAPVLPFHAALPFQPQPAPASPSPAVVLGRAPLGAGGSPPPPGHAIEDEPTYTEPAAPVRAPLPFQPAQPPGGMPPWLARPAGPIEPSAPLFTLESAPIASPIATPVDDRGALGLERQARPAAPAISLEQYARIKTELWDAGVDLREILEEHGVDEIAWRVHERWQADALAAEAREGRSDLALALIAAFERAQAAPEEVPFAVVGTDGEA